MAKATPTKKTTQAAPARTTNGSAAKKAASAKAKLVATAGAKKTVGSKPVKAVKPVKPVKSVAASKPPAANVAASKQAVPARKAAAKKTVPAAPKKAVPAAPKKAVPAAAKKTVPQKNAAVGAAPVKAAPAKKAAVKTATPVKKAAVKSATPVKKVAAVVKKSAPPAAKKPVVRKPTTVICPLSGFEVKPEKPNLSPRVLERLETMLREERARHVAQADTMAAEAELLAAEREGGDTQFDEESGEGDTINIERERDLLLSASANQIVDEIDRALQRIADKTYGVCVPAGRRIAIERLDALPYAETCVDCKARAERRR
jgi:RNA polymerase-binding transcription factor DksA